MSVYRTIGPLVKVFQYIKEWKGENYTCISVSINAGGKITNRLHGENMVNQVNSSFSRRLNSATKKAAQKHK